jgi:hypothetical protein
MHGELLMGQPLTGSSRFGHMTTRKATFALAAVIVLVLGLGTGKALAYFTSHGSGSGTASVAGAPSDITIAINTTPGTTLYPGGTGSLVITATNPNNVDVHVTALTLGTIVGCGTPAITFNSGVLPVTIPAKASSSRIDIVGALTMDTNSTSDCRGVAFSIPLASVTVHE